MTSARTARPGGRASRLFAGVALVALAACGRAPTEIVVLVTTDLDVPADADVLRVTVTEPDGEVRESDVAISSGDAERTLVLLHRGGALGPLEIRASARLGATEVLAARRIVSFEDGRTLHLRIPLDRACATVSCGARTCEAGRCRDPEVGACDLDPAQCSDGGVEDAGAGDAAVDDGGPVDASEPDAGPGCTLPSVGVCGIGEGAVLLPGDRLAPAPCGPLPAGVTVSWRVNGTRVGMLAGAGPWVVVRPDDYVLTGTESEPAGCQVTVSFSVARFQVTPSTGRPATEWRGFAARIGSAFVATRTGPYAVTRAGGWRDLRMGATGDALVDADLYAVAVRGGEPLFAATSDKDFATRILVPAGGGPPTFASVALPRDDRSARAMSVPLDGTESGASGPIAIGTKDGVVLAEGAADAMTTRAVGPILDVAVDVAIASTETATRGAVWALSASTIRNVAVGSGTAWNAGAPVTLPTTMARAVAVDDRSMRLYVCSLDRGLAVYPIDDASLAASGTTLPAAIATVPGACRDVDVDLDRSVWLATSTGLVRVDEDGTEIARLGVEVGAPTSGVARVALAWSGAEREVWARTDAGDVYAIAGSVP